VDVPAISPKPLEPLPPKIIIPSPASVQTPKILPSSTSSEVGQVTTKPPVLPGKVEGATAEPPSLPGKGKEEVESRETVPATKTGVTSSKGSSESIGTKRGRDETDEKLDNTKKAKGAVETVDPTTKGQVQVESQVTKIIPKEDHEVQIKRFEESVKNDSATKEDAQKITKLLRECKGKLSSDRYVELLENTLRLTS
jgi:hypothetical protein